MPSEAASSVKMRRLQLPEHEAHAAKKGEPPWVLQRLFWAVWGFAFCKSF